MLSSDDDSKSGEQVRESIKAASLDKLLSVAADLRDEGHGHRVSYSRKIFIPLTKLCRNVCHYCTFAQTPSKINTAFLEIDEVLRVAELGRQAGCTEALFTLGDKPEDRYRLAQEELARLGFRSIIEYLAGAASQVHRKTGLLPHLNPGVLTIDQMSTLRPVSVSMGTMLESTSLRLCERGGPHYGSPDKQPEIRLATLDTAGKLAVPFTTGLLVGIGETREERIRTILEIRDSHRRHGHVQEVIIQNFRAKHGTRMARAPEPTLDELLWTVAAARIILGPDMNIQAPPNLSPENFGLLVSAGINDWGGVSPVTPDHVNPEAPWPELDRLEHETRMAGKELVARLPLYPRYVDELETWVDSGMHASVLRATDAEGFARCDAWIAGRNDVSPIPVSEVIGGVHSEIDCILDYVSSGGTLTEQQVERLFAARGGEVGKICTIADRLRKEVNGDTVSYVVNRNINYTNVCYFHCRFCAFSKNKGSGQLRGRPYNLDDSEITRRTLEAWSRGATEICMQGGIHPNYTGSTYLHILEVVKQAAPDIHVHAFSPLEVWQGARTEGRDLKSFLEELRDAGLGSLPGTAAEILDDEVRRIICPDKLNTLQWLDVMECAHEVGLRSTATIMFGHRDTPRHWARHLLLIRALQERTGGFTEFVPLPFVPIEAPIYLKGSARCGPTFREVILMHAIARIVLHPYIPNIQASWVKMGLDGIRQSLAAGVNDLGGTLMNESITRAAGAAHGQEMPPEVLEKLICDAGRVPLQRTTLYEAVSAARLEASRGAPPLSPIINRPASSAKRASHRAGRLVRPGLEGTTS